MLSHTHSDAADDMDSGDLDEDNCLLHSLKFDPVAYFKQQAEDEEEHGITPLQCTGISWNATGSVIAVSYGRLDHSGWCNYRAALCTWNVFHPKFDPEKPDLVLETAVPYTRLLHPKDQNSCLVLRVG